MPSQVHKFGGTSVSALETLLALVKLIPCAHKVIVCSAFSAITGSQALPLVCAFIQPATDKLLLCIEQALSKGSHAASDYFEEHVVRVHSRVMDDMHAKGVDVTGARTAVAALVADCRGMLQGVALLKVVSVLGCSWSAIERLV